MSYDDVTMPRDPITERQRMIGVYHHLRNARYLGFITILSFGDWIPRELHYCFTLPETSKLHLKMDAWKMNFGILAGANF